MDRGQEIYNEAMELYELEDFDNAYVRFLVAAKDYENVPAMYMLGIMLIAMKDYENALTFIRSAAFHNYPQALSCLGALFYAGDIIEGDEKKALELFLQASELGDHNADVFIGFIYSDGEIVDRDTKKAFEYFLKGAKFGNAEAQYNVGLCYEDGIGVIKDANEAYKWYVKAAEQEHEKAKEKISID